MDLPQQVLDAAIVELVTPVTVLVQLTHLAHEEIGNLKRKGTRRGMCDGYIFILRDIFTIVDCQKKQIRGNFCLTGISQVKTEPSS